MKLIALYSATSFINGNMNATYVAPVELELPEGNLAILKTSMVDKYGDEYADMILEDFMTEYQQELINMCNVVDAPYFLYYIWSIHRAQTQKDCEKACTSTLLDAIIPFNPAIKTNQLYRFSKADYARFKEGRLKSPSVDDMVTSLQEEDSPYKDHQLLASLGSGVITAEFDDKHTFIITGIDFSQFENGISSKEFEAFSFFEQYYITNYVNSHNGKLQDSVAYQEALAVEFCRTEYAVDLGDADILSYFSEPNNFYECKFHNEHILADVVWVPEDRELIIKEWACVSERFCGHSRRTLQALRRHADIVQIEACLPESWPFWEKMMKEGLITSATDINGTPLRIGSQPASA